jgi:hypothetical protein
MFSFRTQALLTGCLLLVITALAQADVGADLAGCLNENLGKRLGGGESEHLAMEGLRLSGGEFNPADFDADSPSTGDYVWGTLVTEISVVNNKWSDSNPAADCLPGDIIQFGNAEFGETKFAAHHTAVIKEVSSKTPPSSARPTAVWQQNFANNRTVQVAALDTKLLTAGWLRIYRPKAREDETNTYKITLVNSTSDAQQVKVMVDNSVINTFNLSADNTAGSFLCYTVSTTGTVPCLVLCDNTTTIYLQTAKGNSIAKDANGNNALLQLPK